MGNDIGAQQNYQRSMLDAIDTVVQRRMDGLKLDKTVVGIIDKNVGMINGRPIYQVKYEGGVFTATARDISESFTRNTAVYVMIPQSDFSKEKFIIGKANSISATSAESTAISAAINNYVKLGPNLIENSSVIGLRSYHDPKEEINDPNSILHRARFLYSADQNIATSQSVNVSQNLLKTYIQDATNILLRADFRTILDATQQRTASGRYGLAITLTFSNPNAGYGETQGEILDNLGSLIIGNSPKLSVPGYTINVSTNTKGEEEENSGWVGTTNNSIDNTSLKEWDNKLQLFLNSKDASNNIGLWQRDGTGLFDCYSQYIQTMYQTFCVNHAESQSSMTDNLVAAYLNLLKDLKNVNSLSEIKEIYNSWKSTSIGDLSDVDEIIYLTSDMMLGNPFIFNNWNTQYVIPSQSYDFSRFKEVKNIVFFKEGFQQDSEKELIWPLSDAPQDGGNGWDILCQNIQLFLLKDLDSTYQGLSLKVECSDGYDGILRTLSAQEKTSFNAHLYRNQIEELTGNTNIQYVWLKQSAQVINASHPNYYHYAGVGWKRLNNTARYSFQTAGNENWAYKNIYKCIALYQSGNEVIPLSTTFTVYNEAISTKIKLESDLGTNFTFSEGSPIITCKIQEEALPGKTGDEAENYNECSYLELEENKPLYKYQWSIIDSANGSVLFLEEALAENTSNILKENIASNIKMWYLKDGQLEETQDSTKATRIQYPVSLSSTGFTVQCNIQKNFISNGISNYYDVGNDSIEITNLKMGSSSSYRIVIENGDQVFQYDVYGNAPTETKFKDPLEIKPLRAKIVGPTGLEFSGENVNIEWIFNLEDTMIIPPENLILNPATQQEQIVRNSECTFNIEKLYNPNAQNNQITCHAHFSDIDIYADTNFYFSKVGSNGTNGTDVVSKIKYEQPDNYFILHDQPLTILYSKEKEKSKLNLDFISNSDDTGNEITLTPDILNVHLYQKGEEIESANFETGYPRWNLAGNVNGTVNNTGKYFKINNGNIVWDPTYNNSNNDNGKTLLLQNIRSEVKVKKSDQNYYSFFSLPIIEYEGEIPVLPMQRIAIDKSTYLNEVVYNADGRNPIFNHNQGLKLKNLPENSVVYWEARGGLNAIKSERTNVVQEYFETEPSFSLGFEKDTNKTFSTLITQRQFDTNKKRDIYNKEREEVSKKYYYKDEESQEIQGTSLYQLYIKQYEQQNQNKLAEFKSKQLRALQKEAIKKFIEEHTVNASENEVDKDGNILKWSWDIIRNGQRADLDLEECWWFSRNINLWWDSNAVLEDRFLDEECTEPVLIWDEDRYQLPLDPNEEYENKKYSVYYFHRHYYDEEGHEQIRIDSISGPDDKDYGYEIIYCPDIKPPMTPEDYFDSIYPEYTEEKELENIQILEDNITENMIYVLPNDIYDGSATNNRIEAKIYTRDSNNELTLYATVYAPINMILDTFGLDSINAWDGNSVTIDEERGAVLAPQVGAGEKDSNNRFTGILMGKTNTYTGRADLEEQTGLFGYSYGIQSIFLDAKTGNADFGLPSGNSIQLDKDGNFIGLKNDDYNEGRIELRPGGVSKIGGWRLGHRSLYYTQSGEIGPRYQNDYIPNIQTGKIELITPEPYSGHHEKDIDYKDSGILLHSGNDPYISIKGRQLTNADINEKDRGNYLREGDSLEIQLDPKAPTLFTVFRHNGTDWTRPVVEEKADGTTEITKKTVYKEGTRTYLAGINGKGEFVANTVNSIIQDDKENVYTTQFSVNSFRAFNDFKDEENKIEIPGHTGLRIKIGTNILGQMFINNNGFNADALPNEDGQYEHDPTLYITGGLTGTNGEYARPISLHGRYINLFAQDTSNTNKNNNTSDTNLSLRNEKFETNIGSSSIFKLFRDHDHTEPSNLMSANNLKINAGLENKPDVKKEYIICTDIDDETKITKVLKKNINSFYIRVTTAKNTNTFILTDSWDTSKTFLSNGETDSEYMIDATNYPICYKIDGRSDKIYCIKENFENLYYKAGRLPSTIDAKKYEYILVNEILNNRYSNKASTSKISNNEPIKNDQYFRVAKEDLGETDQSYIYLPISSLDLNKKYAYSKEKNQYYYKNAEDDDTVYYQVNNEYKSDFIDNYVQKIKDLTPETGGVYDIDVFDLENLYYKHNDEEKYIDIDYTETRYIQYNIEEYEYDEEGNIINTKYVPQYRVYNAQIDSVDTSNWWYSNGESFILKDDLNFEEEYVKKKNSKTYVLRNNLIYIYVQKNTGDIFSEDDYIAISDNPLHKVFLHDNSTPQYISLNIFNSLIFNYYYSRTKINDSNYILETDIASMDQKYKYNNNKYVIDNSGTYYKTWILNTDSSGTDTEYEYILLTSIAPDDDKTPYINIGTRYYFNKFYDCWVTYSSQQKLNMEQEYLYYYQDGKGYTWSLKKNNEEYYYIVRDYANEYAYVLKDFLDNWESSWEHGDISLYIYLNGWKKIERIEEEESKEIQSSKKYELYAGEYSEKIVTNNNSNRYITLKKNNEGIDLDNNSGGPILIKSNSDIFDLKLLNSREISFGYVDEQKYKKENIIGKFVVDENNNGLNITNNWLRLKSKSYMSLESPTTFSMISSKIGGSGDAPSYNVESPQIVLRAGSEEPIIPGTDKNGIVGAAAELILNSSINGWKSDVNNKALEGRLIWPVFAIRTRYSGIGIYPEFFNGAGRERLYREVFYVRMPQHNTQGISIQGEVPGMSGVGLNVNKRVQAASFKGNGSAIRNTCGNIGLKETTRYGGIGGAFTKFGDTITLHVPSIYVGTDGRPRFEDTTVSFAYTSITAGQVSYGKNPVSDVATEIKNLWAKIGNLESQISSLKKAINNAKSTVPRHRHPIYNHLSRVKVGKEWSDGSFVTKVNAVASGERHFTDYN